MRWTVALLAIAACHRAGGREPPNAAPSYAKPAKLADAAKSATGSAGSASSAAAFPDEEPTTPPPPPTVVPQTKGDCKVAYAPRPTRDPNPMCKVAGGTFLMGEKEKVPTKLSPYYIDEFEVTAAQVAFYLNATHGDPGCVHHDRTGKVAEGTLAACYWVGDAAGDRSNHVFIRRLDNGTYVTEPKTELLPFIGMTREGAIRYCRWAGKQLPTQAQWEFAARHDPTTGKDLIFPWGDKFDGRRARCELKYCPDAPGTDLEFGDSEPVAVGTYNGTHGHGDGRSPWGVYEMAGNAGELVADCEHDLTPCPGGVCVDPPPAGPQIVHEYPAPLKPRMVCNSLTLGGAVQAERQLHVGEVTNPQDEGGFRCVRPVP